MRFRSRLFLLLLLASLACSGPALTPLHLRLGKEGDILAWLVAGPFPNEGALQLHGTGFATDYLGPEASANPGEGDRSGEFIWRIGVGDRAHGLDLIRAIANASPAIGYCFVTLDAPADVDALLLFGSDDGAKVYLNGTVVFSKQIARGVKRDEERVPIHLQKGENRLLFKVEQGDGGWGLMARVVDSANHRLEGLTEVLRIDGAAQDDRNLLRAAVGKPGLLDVEALSLYQSTRENAAQWLGKMRDKALEPGQLDAALAGSAERISNGKADADRLSLALERSEKEISAAYSHARSRLLSWAQNPGPEFAVTPVTEDFVRVMPGGRYFSHGAGLPFIPIGYNHNPDWPELENANPLAKDFEPSRTEAWFSNLERHGVNVIRLMVETPQSGNLEESAGTFRPEHILWLDAIFASARRHGVRLWITPYDTFWMNLRSDASPYWAKNGGPIVKPVDFLTSPAVIELQKKRMKFLIDRYGNTGTVFAWEIMNEIDLWWGATPAQISAWTDQMASYVRGYQRQKWGKDHLVTISFGKPEPTGLNAETAFRRRDMDFATMHLYLGASRAPQPGMAERAGEDFAAGVRYARAQVQDNRPVLDGESGPIDRWVKEAALDNEVFYQMSWQHLMSGGAGGGTRWPYRNPHHLTPGMLETLHAMRTFCDDVPWAALTGPTREPSVKEVRNVAVSFFATSGASILWLRSPGVGGRIIFNTDARTAYRLFDIRHGTWIGSIRYAPAGELAISMPPGIPEIAIWTQSQTGR